jgi:geranylgeranyl pyrophosphate synthase
LVFHEELSALVLTQREIAAWPQMAQVAEHALSNSSHIWQWPVVACQSAGGSPAAALPGAAAAFCMILSISLVDDMLDEDPRGAHQQLGMAATANLALAFQAAALRLLAEARMSGARHAEASDCLAELALSTAYGQSLSTSEPGDEAAYWKVLRAKSTPFYAAVLQLGGLIADAPAEIVRALGELGTLCGESAQLHDDLKDAFQAPASPDWRRGRGNLLILYALTAEHPERVRFAELQDRVAEPEALRSAQQILIRCGAVSYCALHLIRCQRAAQQILQSIPLPDPAPLARVLERQTATVDALLATLQLGPLASLLPS